jgi:hypothetical protein
VSRGQRGGSPTVVNLVNLVNLVRNSKKLKQVSVSGSVSEECRPLGCDSVTFVRTDVSEQLQPPTSG